MGTIPEFHPEPEPEPTPQAESEAASFAARELQRGDVRNAHLHVGSLVLFWTIVITAFVMLLIWSYHLVTPDTWHFLSQQGIDKLQTILFSFAGSSVATSLSKKWTVTKPAE